MACDSAGTPSSAFFPGHDDSDMGDCRSEFEPLVKRAGGLGQVTLGYACGASDCSGDEAFGDNLRHDVRIDLPYTGDAEFTIESDEPSIATAQIQHIDMDACASEARAYAQLEAHQSGTTTLRVRNRGVEIDNIEIRIATARALSLRASSLSAFDFSETDESVEVTLGEALLVMPRLLDKDGHTLLGTPALTWQSENDEVASVRETAVSDEEEIVRSTTADSAVFVDSLSTGETVIIARTSEDIAAALEVRVRSEYGR